MSVKLVRLSKMCFNETSTLTVDALASPCGICDGKDGTGTDFSLST
jgi:hypothetical protein